MPENQPPKPSNQTALLIQLLQDVAEIKAGLTSITDHEIRIRELEKAQWKSAWITGLLSAAISSTIIAIIIRSIGA